MAELRRDRLLFIEVKVSLNAIYPVFAPSFNIAPFIDLGSVIEFRRELAFSMWKSDCTDGATRWVASRDLGEPILPSAVFRLESNELALMNCFRRHQTSVSEWMKFHTDH